MKKWGARRGEGQLFALAQHLPLLRLNIYKETKKAIFPEMSVPVLLLFYTKDQVAQHVYVRVLTFGSFFSFIEFKATFPVS